MWLEILILVAIGAGVFFAVRYIVRQKKKGGCVGCSQCNNCNLDPKSCGKQANERDGK